MDKKEKAFFFFYGALLFLLKWFILKINFVEERFEVCADFLLQGILYSGQPECHHGTFLYVTLAIFKLIFGSYFVYALDIFNIVILIIITLLIRKITHLNLSLLLALVAGLLFIPAINHLSTFYAMAYVFIGFYFLFYTSLKKSIHYILIGILFALGFFSNVGGITLTISIYLFYLITETRNKRLYSSIKNTTLLIIPIIGLLLIFNFLLPNSFYYYLNVYLNSQQLSVSYTATILNFLRIFIPPSFNLVTVIIYIFFYILLLILIFNFAVKNKFVFIPFFGLLLMVYGRSLTDDMFFVRDFIQILPFVILCINPLYERVKQHTRYNLFFLLLLSLLLFSAVRTQIDFYQASGRFHKLNSLLEGTLNELDIQGNILIEGRRFANSRYFTEYFTDSRVDYYPTFFVDRVTAFLINSSSPQVIGKEWIAVNDTQHFPRTNFTDIDVSGGMQRWVNTEDIERVTIKLLTQNYDAILLGPDFGSTEVFSYFLLPYWDRINETNYACDIPIFTLAHKCETCNRFMLLIFKNETLCRENAMENRQYYSDNFKQICKADNTVANNVAYNLNFMIYGLNLSRNYLGACYSGNFLLKDLDQNRLTKRDYILLILIIAILAPSFLTRNANKK